VTFQDPPPEQQEPPIMIHRLLGPSTTTVRWWDRLAYAVSLILLLTVAFYQGTLGSRITQNEEAIRTRVLASEQRYAEDHAMLMSVYTIQQQRTVRLDELERKVGRLEGLMIRKRADAR
jgi:hypothetical protein